MLIRALILIFLLFSFKDFSIAQQQTNTNETVATNFFGTAPIADTNYQAAPLILQDIREIRNQSKLNTTLMFVRAVIGFIVTLAGIYFVYMYLKKRSKKIGGADDIIKVLATTPVATNRYISIIDIAGEMYLIAIADHNITMLSKIEDKETKDQILIGYSNSKENVVEDSFKNMFDKIIPSLSRKKSSDIEPLNTSRDIKERLQKLNPDRNDKTKKDS